MQLDAAQMRIIKSKPSGVSLLKGLSSTGKTMTAVYRTLYLKNSYCLYDEDKILILSKDSTNRDFIRDTYNKIEDETRFDYITLFSNTVDRVEIFTVEDLINRFYFEYTNNTKRWYKIIQENDEKVKILKSCIDNLRKAYGNIKIISDPYINFLKEEIEWIKACGYLSEANYQSAERLGRRYKSGQGPRRILKNSRERSILFALYEAYNAELEKNGLIDSEGIQLLALKQLKESTDARYTHILIDEAQQLNKIQIEFVKELSKKGIYSSIMYILNKSVTLDYKSWFEKGRKVKSLDLGDSIRNFTLNKIYDNIKEGAKTMDINNKEDKMQSSVESFQYIDLRHHRRFDFKRDFSAMNEVIVEYGSEEQLFVKEELRTLPVYSDIAAGEPILMNSELEAEFYIPEPWLKGANGCFILKVKGDSMVGADIFHGDYVVIRKQNSAQNGDIVAVDLDGNATLKRLSLKKGAAVLMPENDKYDPIFIHDRQASVIGIAVGIIKNRN